VAPQQIAPQLSLPIGPPDAHVSPAPHAEPFPHRHVPASQRSPAPQHELPHAGPAQLVLGAHVPAVTALQCLLSHVAMMVSPGPGAPPSSA
jgi:hypothetical protein